MSQPIPADLDLNAIRAELAEIKDRFGDRHYRGETAWFSSMWANVGRHVPALLAEVERLRADEPWVSMIEQRDEAIAERDRLHQIIGTLDAWIYSNQPSLIGANPVSAVIGVVDEAWAENGRVRGQRNDLADEVDRLREELRVAGAKHYAEVQRLREDVIRPLRAERDRLRAQITEAEAVIVRAQDALGVDHPVWVVLDDYDGSMDSVKALVRERDEARAQRDDALDRMVIAHQQRDDARAERDRYVEVVEAARVWRAQFSRPKTHFPLPRMDALIAAVDRLTPGDETSS